jgi:hypothetical protein
MHSRELEQGHTILQHPGYGSRVLPRRIVVSVKNRLHPIALRRENNEAKFAFIIAELDLAATFCERASIASDSTEGERNLNNALTAYGTAIRFAKEAKLTPGMSQQIKGKINQLDAILHSFIGWN